MLKGIMIALAMSLLFLVITSNVIAAEKITLRFAHVMPATHMTQQVALWIKSELAKRSGGQINFEIFPAEMLGNVLEQAEAVRTGTLDMFSCHGPVSRFWPAFGVIDFPYIVMDWSHWEKIYWGNPGKELSDGLLENTGIRILGWWPHGFRNVLSTKPIPVLEPKDMKGVKIRMHPNPIAMETFKAFGASPVPMGYGEIYTSLSSGVIDAMEGTPMSMVSGRFIEVAKYLAHTQHFFLTDSIAISEKRFKSLPSDIQKTLSDVCKESQKIWSDLAIKDNITSFEKIRKTIKWETYPDLRSLSQAVKPPFEKIAKEIKIDGWIDKVERIK